MKNNYLKLIAIAIFTVLITAVLAFQTESLTLTTVKAGDVADDYKKSCQMCHSPTAEKHFDPAKTDDQLADVIMKGKKPMPGYEAKGWTIEQAKAMVTHMRSLRPKQ